MKTRTRKNIPNTDCLIRNLKAWKDAAKSDTVHFSTLAMGECPEDSTIGDLIDGAFAELAPLENAISSTK